MELIAHDVRLGATAGGRKADRLGRQELGAFGEDLAVDHLIGADGYQVVARNWRTRTSHAGGEIDVVARESAHGCLVVVEVKARRSADRFGGAVAAVGPEKVRRLRGLARLFLQAQAIQAPCVRFDFIAIDLGAEPRLTHFLGIA